MEDENVLPAWAKVDLGHGFSHSRFVRHLRVEGGSHSIKNRFVVGPNAPNVHPPLFDQPVERVVAQASSSASFETKSSAIDVELWIMGNAQVEEKLGMETAKRATKSDGLSKALPVSVALKSYMGRCRLVIPRYTASCPLHIRAKSHNGAIHIHLPPSFSGLVSWRSENGVLHLSPKIKERYVALGESYKHRGVGVLTAQGESKPNEQTVGKVKAKAEKKGLRPKSSSGGKGGSSSSTSPAISRGGSPEIGVNAGPPGSLAGPSSSSVAGGGEVSEKGLGLPANAAAVAASVSGSVTRGDACELISTYGSIYLYEASEGMGLRESCVIA